MYEVKGFIFESEAVANAAQKEADAIKYIKTQTKMNDPETVLELYNKLLQKKMFETPVGIAFLVELQEYLRTIPFIKNEDLRAIPIREKKQSEVKSKPIAQKTVKVRKDDGYKGKFKITMFLSVIFALMIIGMFIITYASGNNVNIINYENEIINKYEKWEEELEIKEAELKEREALLEKGDNDE